MPSQEEFDKLKGRIVELENALKERGDVPDITPEEMETFKKVYDKLARDSVGVQLCLPPPIPRRIAVCFLCKPCYPCYPCYECTCGPCIQWDPVISSGVGRFGGLGG